jgi:hypothetical protein
MNYRNEAKVDACRARRLNNPIMSDLVTPSPLHELQAEVTRLQRYMASAEAEQNTMKELLEEMLRSDAASQAHARVRLEQQIQRVNVRTAMLEAATASVRALTLRLVDVEQPLSVAVM